jgi:hypothetical protein
MTLESTPAKRSLHSCLPCLYLKVGHGSIESPYRRDCSRQTLTFSYRLRSCCARSHRPLFSLSAMGCLRRSIRSDRKTMLALSGSAESPWRFGYHRALWAPSHPLQLAVTNMRVGPNNRPSNVTSEGPFGGQGSFGGQLS